MLNRMLILFVLSILIVALSGPVLAGQRFDIEPLKSAWDPPVQIGMPTDNDDEGDDSGLGFGKKIAGAWMGSGEFMVDADFTGEHPEFTCDGVGDTPPIPFAYDLQSFTASGLYIVTNPGNPLLAHGEWKKTGPREVTTNNVVYENDADGALMWVMRIPGVFTFNSDFTEATSTFGAVGYLPGQNPLDPAETPAWCTIGTHFRLQKVTVTP